MKILLTGHRGFIGSNMLKALSGHDVRTYDWGEDEDKLDTRDRDVCIHIGGISSTTERDVDKVMRQNYDFSCCLLDRCMNTGTHFQYSSSASVYGLNQEFREDSPVDPRTPYAWSKYMFERYAAKRQEFADQVGDRIQGFRYFNVYGSGEAHKGGQASPYHQFENQAKETGRIRVFEGSREYRRDFVPVSQVIDTHLAFLNIKQSGVFNVGTGRTQSFYEVAEQFGVPIDEIPMPEHLKQSYQTYTCADMTRTDRAIAS
jgi:ADP-L-glycero-D-manno-heptose 6-epimerase